MLGLVKAFNIGACVERNLLYIETIDTVVHLKINIIFGGLFSSFNLFTHPKKNKQEVIKKPIVFFFILVRCLSNLKNNYSI